MSYDKSLIANRLDMKPETFSRVLAQLVSQGVEVNGARVVIANIGLLTDLLSVE